jgi:Putative ABC exporter
LAAATAAVWYAGQSLPDQGWRPALAQLEQAPVMRAFLEVPRWFIRTTVVERYWPDFVLWGGICFGIDAVLALLLFKLDAVNVEAAAVAGERFYARLQQIRKGERITLLPDRSAKPRASLPALPWWGGVGPVAWRQLQTLVRRRWILSLVILVPLGLSLLERLLFGNVDGDAVAPITLGIIVLLVPGFLPSLFSFDFRKDLDRMDLLKALPVGSTALVIGQILTPVVCWTIIQTLATLGFAVFISRLEATAVMWAILPLAVPVNVLLVTLDNIVFLLSPSRPLATPGAQLSGLKMVLNFAKFLMLYAACGIAAGLGLGAYYLSGRQLWPAIVVAWLVLAVFAAAMVPLAALAFQRFDVARDRPA